MGHYLVEREGNGHLVDFSLTMVTIRSWRILFEGGQVRIWNAISLSVQVEWIAQGNMMIRFLEPSYYIIGVRQDNWTRRVTE